MNFDPSIMPPDVVLWRSLLTMAVSLPLVFLCFMLLVVTGIMAIGMTEGVMRDEIEKAGPIKGFFLEVFVAPTLALVCQYMLCMFIVGVACGAASQNYDRK